MSIPDSRRFSIMDLAMKLLTPLGNNTGKRFFGRSWQLWVFIGSTLFITVGFSIYILRYGVNVIYWDEWAVVPLVHNSISGTLTLGQLWGQHNESRMFFPYILEITVARMSHWNEFALYFLSFAFLCITVVLIAWMFRAEIRRQPILWLPLPLLAFTLIQYENILWGFQFSWFLILLCIMGTAVLLSGERLSKKRLAGAIIVGIVASYSSLQGLIVWPVGLVLLITKGRPKTPGFVWGAVGILATIGYFIGYDYSNGGAGTHLISLASIQGLFVAAGSVVPVVINLPGIQQGSYLLPEIFGFIIIVGGALVCLSWLFNGRPGGSKAFTVVLVLTGMVFDVLLIPGRLGTGLSDLISSRYTTYNWPLLLGIYAAVLIWCHEEKKWKLQAIACQSLVTTLVVVQVIVGIRLGITQGRNIHQERETAATLVANWPYSSQKLAEKDVLPYPQVLDVDIPYLRAEHMSVFAYGNKTALSRKS